MLTAVRVGNTVSKVTELPSVASTTCVSAFPARSLASIVNVTRPSLWSLVIVATQVQAVPALLLVSVTTTGVTEAPPLLNTHVGVVIGSSGVIVTVTVLPTLARVG